MAKQPKRVKHETAEWIEEGVIGHDAAFRKGDVLFVECRVYGVVRINGEEYEVNQVIPVVAQRKGD